MNTTLYGQQYGRESEFTKEIRTLPPLHTNGDFWIRNNKKMVALSQAPLWMGLQFDVNLSEFGRKIISLKV